MKASTKVTFIERVSKSMLGLDGLQIIAICDKTKGDDIINFKEIGEKCLTEIDGNYIKNKYNLKEGLILKTKLHEERVKWMKNYINGDENK